jgi:hypothetical protein
LQAFGSASIRYAFSPYSCCFSHNTDTSPTPPLGIQTF